ncbi:zf-ZPR1-domain-containing protein [Meira miltonrushii]|uniref:Zf-ZPR1-domain-containing protein n=1 Tax=Meira miltonrushii TaxID=1280837 RepID=A0A316VCD2_9BASI|nr:zf-ZPR1-domain-containing protein [Meira miltonrushii]PWN33641.1 zf-ZPR1-domain-containing protein [Meira miltonrushii]
MSANNSNDPFFKPIGEQVANNAGEEQMATPTAGSEVEGQQDQDQPVQEIESLCMECGKMGSTRLLLTFIPYFREVIIASFYCEHCGNRNNEIQSAGMIQPKGCIYTIHVTAVSDLNRQVVKSEHATITVPEIQLTIPNKRGQLTTIEGILSDTLRDLEMDQPLRKHMQPEVYEKIEQICSRLRIVVGEEKEEEGEEPSSADNQAQEGLSSKGPVGNSRKTADKDDESRQFPSLTFKIDDPTGNSFVEFTGSIEGKGMSDVKWSKRDYPRTKEQNTALGLGINQEEPQADKDTREAGTGPQKGGSTDSKAESREQKRSKGQDGEAVPMASKADAIDATGLGGGFNRDAGETEFDNEEVFTFPGTCSSCSAPLETNMKKVNIPYFKDILIMSTNCDSCGYRDNEVKSGSAIPPKGRKLTLRVEDAEDLSRDILKSESAGLSIPDIDLHLAPGTLGGRFTTLEGLLQQVYDELSERVLMRGDSSIQKENLEGFLGKLKGVMSAQLCPYTVILDDPLADSYIQNPYAPDKDEQIEEVEYERTWDQNEDLGLNDIKVEDYSEESKQWRLDAEKGNNETSQSANDTKMDG